ncbi:MAG: outer membrane beta-barrel protein [Gammaproteobacteria bacterium]|nr:outer membrane beta-barrel protein [Gammaproteobacteria bacterium]
MNNRKKYLLASVLFTVLSTSSMVHAEKGDSYFGVGLGNASPDDSAYDGAIGWRFFGGHSVNQNFALEAGYISFGDMDGPVTPEGETKVLSSTGFDFSAIGSYPFADKFAVFGKLGFLVWGSKWSNSGPTGGAVSTGDTDLFYGLGGRFDLSDSIGFLGTWERYSLGDDVDLLSASVIYRF